MINNFDIVFLSKQAIGNSLEMMYAVEYCLLINVKAAIYIVDSNKQFECYLRSCYGEDVVLSSLDGVFAENLVHTFIVNEKIDIKYKNFFYICPDAISTKYQSETEQYLSVVKALYPGGGRSDVLSFLRGNNSGGVAKLDVEKKYVIYPGCSSFAAVRRWPWYDSLINKLGEDNLIIIGGIDDLIDVYAHRYKKNVGTLFNYRLTNRKIFWKLCSRLNLLEPFAHNTFFSNAKYSYFNVFNFEELVAIFRSCKAFIGNDGGLMHLAAASGAKGLAIFGPTSVDKSKPYSSRMKAICKNYACQPCHFGQDKIYIGNYFISCPYSVKCLEDISVDEILHELSEIQN